MATAFLDILPEAHELSANWAFFALAAFLALYLVEFGLNIHFHEGHSHDLHAHQAAAGRISAFAIAIHSLMDGFTIGVGFGAGFALGVITSFAVIFHELPEGVFTYTLLMRDRVEERRATIYSWLVALATPFGAMITYLFVRNASEAVLGNLLAVAGGMFIYIGAADLVPETHRRSRLGNAALVMLGVGLVLVLTQLVG
jgi:zinc transporter ZupT